MSIGLIDNADDADDDFLGNDGDWVDRRNLRDGGKAFFGSGVGFILTIP